MKLKHALIPYVLIIVILPAILYHLGSPFGLPQSTWDWILDGLMAAVTVVGLAAVIIDRKKKFRGWIALLVLLIFFLLPQLFLWKTQDRGFVILRQIYRFSMLYVTLFIIPMEIHLRRKELCILIGCFVVYGLICCAYEIVRHPTFWDSMSFFTGKATSGVESFFDQKNRFGGYLALWIILCIFAVELSENKLWIIPAVIFGVFLVATESRGGLLLTGVFILVMLFSYHKRLGFSNTVMIFLDIAVVLALLFLIPTTREFIFSIIDVDRGVTGRDEIWQVAWDYYLESNPLFGHGVGVEIERIMIERISANVSTHNVYLYILNSGGISLVIFYVLSYIIILNHPCYRHHYLIPLLIATLAYGFFELACIPFDFWHLSNMFTVCLFFIPGSSGLREHHHQHHHNRSNKSHRKSGLVIYSPEGRFDYESELDKTPVQSEKPQDEETPEKTDSSTDDFDFEKAVAEEKARLGIDETENNQTPVRPNGNQMYGSPYGSGMPGQPYGNQMYGSPYGSMMPGQPYGNQMPGSPYGSGMPGQPYGNQMPGLPYGSGMPGRPYGNQMPGSPYGNGMSGQPSNNQNNNSGSPS